MPYRFTTGVTRAAARTAVVGAAGAVALTLVGCAGSAAAESRPLVAVYQTAGPLDESPRIALAEPELEGLFTFGEPQFEQTADASSLRVPITNAGKYRYGITYRVIWFDDEGQPLNLTGNAVRMRLEPGQTLAIRDTAGSEAVDYRVNLDWAR